VAALAVAGYALLCAVAARSALSLARYDEPEAGGTALPALVCLGLTSLAGCGLFLVQLASYTHIMALASLLALALAAEDAGRSGTRYLVPLAAVPVAVAQSWYLLLPVAGLMLVPLLVASRPPLRLWLPLGVASASLCLYPLLTGPSRLHVDEGGSTLLPTIGGILSLLVITAIGIARATHERAVVAQVLATGTVGALLMMVVLVVRQGYVSGTGISYYGAKLLISTFLLGTVLAGAAAVRAPRPLLFALLVGLLWGTKASAWASFPPTAGDYAGHLDPAVLQAQVEMHPHGPPVGTDVVVADGCDRVGDMVASKWLYDTSLTWPDGLRAVLNDYAAEVPGSTTALRERLQRHDVRHIDLWVRHPCDIAALSELERSPKVRVIRVP
jgi:hypothetical protein